MKTFNELFNEHTGESILKWSNYGDIYDNNIKQFKTLDEAGKFLFLAEHVKKEVQENLILRENF